MLPGNPTLPPGCSSADIDRRFGDPVSVDCPACEGDCKVDGEDCRKCEGAGTIAEWEL